MKTDFTLKQSDLSLAHFLARLCLGIDIAVHGISRLGALPAFAQGMEKMFAATWLPAWSVLAMGYVIPVAELLIGLGVLVGFLLRPALVMGMLLMSVLLFGTCLLQKWDGAASQLIYVAFYAALLATAGWDRFSLDAARRP